MHKYSAVPFSNSMQSLMLKFEAHQPNITDPEHMVTGQNSYKRDNYEERLQ